MLTDKEEIELLRLLEEEDAEKSRRNPLFTIVHEFKGRYVVLIGGSGSGKSYEIADRVDERVKSEPKSRILGVRSERKQVTESQFPLLWSRTDFHKGFDRNKAQGNEKIFHEKGGEILFSGLDDVDKLKSIFDITSVWIEEADQVTGEDVRELDRRLRGYDGEQGIACNCGNDIDDNYTN